MTPACLAGSGFSAFAGSGTR